MHRILVFGALTASALFTGAPLALPAPVIAPIPTTKDGGAQGGDARPPSSTVDVRDFGAKGDGSSDDTGAIRAAIDHIARIGAEVGIVRFPASPQPYLSREITLTSADRHIVLAGDGVRGSRLRIVGTTAGHGVAFSARDNSWGGLQSIRVEAAVAMTSVVYVKEPGNAFIAEKLFVNGGGLAKDGVEIEGGSAITFDWSYITGVTDFNFHLRNQSTNSSIVFEGGNHDVGGKGILLVESTYAGPLVLFVGGRFEGGAGKDLFQFATPAPATLRVYGALFTGGSPRSMIKAISGAPPRWLLDATHRDPPAAVLADSQPPSSGVRERSPDPEAKGIGVTFRGSGWSADHLQLGRHYLWIDRKGGLRVKDGVPASDSDGVMIGTEACGKEGR